MEDDTLTAIVIALSILGIVAVVGIVAIVLLSKNESIWKSPNSESGYIVSAIKRERKNERGVEMPYTIELDASRARDREEIFIHRAKRLTLVPPPVATMVSFSVKETPMKFNPGTGYTWDFGDSVVTRIYVSNDAGSGKIRFIVEP